MGWAGAREGTAQPPARVLELMCSGLTILHATQWAAETQC